jgi:hypothetical protein
MALSVLELSRQQALEAAGLVCLPDAVDANSSVVWLHAIGLVKKVGGYKNYVLLDSDGESTRIRRDFGAMAQIIEIEEIYPYECLEKRFMPSLPTDEATIYYLNKQLDNGEEVRQLLDPTGKNFDQINKDRATVRKMVMQCAIRYGKKVLADEQKYKALTNQIQQENGTKEETDQQPRRTTKRGRKPTAGKS